MNCLYCGTEIAPLGSLQYSEYCSDEHYVESACEHTAADYLILLDPPEFASPQEVTNPVPALCVPDVPLQYPLLERTPTFEPEVAIGSWSDLALHPVAGGRGVRDEVATQRPFGFAPLLELHHALQATFGSVAGLPAGEFCGGSAPRPAMPATRAPEFALEPRFAHQRLADGLRWASGDTFPSPELQLAGPSGFSMCPKPCEPMPAAVRAPSIPPSVLRVAPLLPPFKSSNGREPALPWASMADLSIFPGPVEPQDAQVIPAPRSAPRFLVFPKVKLFPSTPDFQSEPTLPRDNEPDLRQLFSATPRRDWGSMFRRWLEVPRYLKILASLVPVILAAMLASAGSTSGTVSKVSQGSLLTKPFSSLKATLRQRAAVVASDDFRDGMDRWRVRGDFTAPWVIDSNQFVHPVAFATFAPSADLSDYNLEFQVQVDRHALGVAFRVQGWNDYYVLKVPQPATSTTPAGDIVWYKVVGGKEIGRVAHPFPKGIPRNSLQTVRLEVAGGDFTLISQGKVVDYWSDGRFRKGGIGFFCTKGDRARIRWVEVRHQDDFVGQLCALLAPPDAQIRNRSGNQQ